MRNIVFIANINLGDNRSNPYKDSIDYVQIITTGNALDFGDLTDGIFGNVGCNSNGHGGLG